jgi:hypothetical protein
MKIKKQIKKEKSRRSRVIFLSVIIMIIVPYIITVLSNQGTFRGWEENFSLIYAVIIDLLLMINIIRLKMDDNFDMTAKDGRIIIKDRILKSPFVLNPEKATYVEARDKNNGDFEIIIIMNNMKREKRFQRFNEEYVNQHSQYRTIYTHLMATREDKDFCFYIIGKAGARKYYYLYLLFKNLYGAEFSKTAVEKVKMIMEEYNLS